MLIVFNLFRQKELGWIALFYRKKTAKTLLIWQTTSQRVWRFILWRNMRKFLTSSSRNNDTTNWMNRRRKYKMNNVVIVIWTKCSIILPSEGVEFLINYKQPLCLSYHTLLWNNTNKTGVNYCVQSNVLLLKD